MSKKPFLASHSGGSRRRPGLKSFFRALFDRSLRRKVRLVIFGDWRWLETVSRRVFHRMLPPHVLRLFPGEARAIASRVRPRGRGDRLCDYSRAGRRDGEAPSLLAGRASAAYIEGAVRAAMERWVDAVVTAPINKIAFHGTRWGRSFPEHTEMIGALIHAKAFEGLMLMHGALRAVHVHLLTFRCATFLAPSQKASR